VPPAKPIATTISTSTGKYWINCDCSMSAI
jgi:hypothetical protein